jgi:Tfp pilus assembly protein PilN
MRAVNLIPAEQRDRHSGLANRSNGAAYVVVAMLAVLALLAFLYGSARHEVSAKETDAAKIEAQARSIQQQATSLAPYKSFVALRESRESAIATLVNSRFDWAHVVLQLGQVLPPHTSITSFQGTVGSAAPAGGSSASSAASSGAVSSATPAGSTPSLALAGCASSQSAVALTMARLRLIDGVGNVELHNAVRSSAAGGAAAAGGGAAAGGATGGCPSGYSSFSVTVTFEPLPAPPTSAAPGATSAGASASPAANGGAPSPAARASVATSASQGVAR